MNNKLKKAIALREEVAELDGLAFEASWHGYELTEEDEKKEEKALKLWQQHAELLKQVYPKPDPRDPIQVTILDTYRFEAIVLKTSFTNIDQYNKAVSQLSDYELVSDQVNQCELCDEYYLTKNGVSNKKESFCSTECLKEDQFKRQRWAKDDEYEYDEWYDYNFPDGDIHDRDVPEW